MEESHRSAPWDQTPESQDRDSDDTQRTHGQEMGASSVDTTQLPISKKQASYLQSLESMKSPTGAVAKGSVAARAQSVADKAEARSKSPDKRK